MTISKFPLALLLSVIIGSAASAQPSDAVVKKELAGPGVLEVRLSPNPGVRAWNESSNNWEYRKYADVLRSTEYPGIKLLVRGAAVYQATGAGKYSYLRFAVLLNRYEGIPDPTESEIQHVISRDWKKFYGYWFHKITRLAESPRLAADPGFDWDKPTSVTFRMTATYDVIASSTRVETVEQVFKVKLFRDDMKQPWKSFMATAQQDKDDRKLIESKTLSAEEVKELEKSTLAYTLGEQSAGEHLASLPDVTVPEFASASELVAFVHGILRDGTPEQFEATMVRVLGPRFFVAGSATQLNQGGKDLVAKVITAAYKGKVTYKLLYCATVATNPALTTPKHVVVLSCVKNVASSFDGEQVNAGYVEGKPVTQWKLTSMSVIVKQDQDTYNFINSFSDRKKLCPND